MIYKGTRVTDVNTDVGYMTQKDNLLPWRNVRDNIAFPLELAGVAKAERETRADAVIKQVGLDGFEPRFPTELSGGMRKRACLARMMLYGAETALLDEPFAALDAQLKLAMHDLLLRLAAENGQTVRLRHSRPDGSGDACRPRLRLHAAAGDDRAGAEHRSASARATCSTCASPASSRTSTTRCGNACAWNTRRSGYERAGGTLDDERAKGKPVSGAARIRQRRHAACQTVLGIAFFLSGRAYPGGWSTTSSSPTHSMSAAALGMDDGRLNFRHLWATVYATIVGFVIGAVIGVMLGIWLGVSRFASRLLNPYLNALNALPKVALAPLFVLWFGLGIESKIALAAVLVLFLVFLNTFAGVREVDQDLIDGARLMRATRMQLLTKVIVPSAMSWVFAGLKSPCLTR